MSGALCWTGGSDELQPATSNQTEPHCVAELPQVTGPPLSGVNELSVASRCDRGEEEDGEEEEVDVLVFSPEKGPPVTACADGLSSVVIVSDDEEEDEDMDDIDVTGWRVDEAEWLFHTRISFFFFLQFCFHVSKTNLV